VDTIITSHKFHIISKTINNTVKKVYVVASFVNIVVCQNVYSSDFCVHVVRCAIEFGPTPSHIHCKVIWSWNDFCGHLSPTSYSIRPVCQLMG